jgi:hypothetical protein
VGFLGRFFLLVFLGGFFYCQPCLEAGAPLLDLHLPVEHDRGGHHNEVGAPVGAVHGQVGEEGDGLDGLAEAHLVGEDPVEVPFVERDEPVQADVLVFSQGVLQQGGNCKGVQAL